MGCRRSFWGIKRFLLPNPWIQAMSHPFDYGAELERWRQERDQFLKHHYASPLADEVIADFTGIAYFPPEAAWRFTVMMEREDSSVPIESSTGAISRYPCAGIAEIPFAAGPARMRVLRGEEDDLFIPFRDLTSGVSTYSGGRYVAVDLLRDDGFVVDFNKATNPYCAYDEEFSCPLPPPGNILRFP